MAPRRGTYSLDMPIHLIPAVKPASVADRMRRSLLRMTRRSTAITGGWLIVVGAACANTLVQPLVIGDPGANSTPASADSSPLPANLEESLRAQLQKIALNSSQQALPGVNRVEIEVGRLDPRLKLAPCQSVEPYLPNSTRLWGRTRIGLRCTQGTSPWNVYLPITVKVYGPAWVAAATLAPGATINAEDLVQAEIDFAEDAAPILTDPDQAIGRVVTRRIAAGQGLRATDIRPRQWFSAGDAVKIVAQGPGFTISGSGEALAHGVEGRSIRVRIDNGRIISGTAIGDRRVEVRP